MWLIQNKKTKLYLTEFHIGKNRLTNEWLDWTPVKDLADVFDAKPTKTIELLCLSELCDIVPFETK